MSRCGRTAQLEELLASSLSPAALAELEAHAGHCALCAHELRWLRTEEALFTQRRTRQQVRQLYQQSRPARPERRVWSTVALALAASALLVLGLGGRDLPTSSRGHEAATEMSIELASLGTVDDECSLPQPGIGFACEPVVLASFR